MTRTRARALVWRAMDRRRRGGDERRGGTEGWMGARGGESCLSTVRRLQQFKFRLFFSVFSLWA